MSYTLVNHKVALAYLFVLTKFSIVAPLAAKIKRHLIGANRQLFPLLKDKSFTVGMPVD